MRWISKITLAPVINFTALLALFSLITYLHHTERPKIEESAQFESPKQFETPSPAPVKKFRKSAAKIAVLEKVPDTRTSVELGKIVPEKENEVRIEDLDNEAARQGYLASNRTVKKTERKEASISADDFIPFEKK